MTEFFYDLHIHSCLSPCGDMEMTPNNIAGMAFIKGLKIIALTDHNTARNVPALIKAAAKYDLTVIPGMELTTQEEVHVLCLFSDAEDALAFDRFVYDHLIKVKNRTEFFGRQVQMNENDEPVAEEENLLINATDISFDSVFDIVTDFKGIMIPAHLDKDTTSLISNLGLIPPDPGFTCAEVNDPAKLQGLLKAHPYLKRCRIISNSDAHYLQDISEPVHSLLLDSEHPHPKEILEMLIS